MSTFLELAGYAFWTVWTWVLVCALIGAIALLLHLPGKLRRRRLVRRMEWSTPQYSIRGTARRV